MAFNPFAWGLDKRFFSSTFDPFAEKRSFQFHQSFFASNNFDGQQRSDSWNHSMRSSSNSIQRDAHHRLLRTNYSRHSDRHWAPREPSCFRCSADSRSDSEPRRIAECPTYRSALPTALVLRWSRHAPREESICKTCLLVLRRLVLVCVHSHWRSSRWAVHSSVEDIVATLIWSINSLDNLRVSTDDECNVRQRRVDRWTLDSLKARWSPISTRRERKERVRSLSCRSFDDPTIDEDDSLDVHRRREEKIFIKHWRNISIDGDDDSLSLSETNRWKWFGRDRLIGKEQHEKIFEHRHIGKERKRIFRRETSTDQRELKTIDVFSRRTWKRRTILSVIVENNVFIDPRETIQAFDRSTEECLCQSSRDLFAEHRLPSRLACSWLTIDRAETAWRNLFHPWSQGKNEDIHWSRTTG